jgi:glycosyltransferase involved in cell wall biosynthesis
MWEAFFPEHAEPAKRALDVIYCFSEADRERYAEMGIDSPRVPWGCHPELDAFTPRRRGDEVRLFYPGGFMTDRKPLKPVLKAFTEASDERLRLVMKAQVERKTGRVRRMAERDPRIEVVYADLPTAEHLQLFADCHACLAPSRWEGLGLHLFEATAFGMPIITNDNPPMNELVEDGLNGILVRGLPDGQAKSGVPAFAPDPDGLVAAIERIADEELRTQLSKGALEMKRRLSWERTVTALGDVLERAIGGARLPFPA